MATGCHYRRHLGGPDNTSGGIQYYVPYPVVDLLPAGYIREVT